MKASLGTFFRSFALTIAAIVCVALDRYIAFDALGSAGAILTALLRAYLSPLNFLQHQFFRLSIHVWQPAAPLWYSWLTLIAGLTPYIALDMLLEGLKADRAALDRRP